MIFKSKLRIVLALTALLLLSIIGVIVVEKSSGSRRLKKARQAYLTDGGNFDPTSRFATPVPDEDNFGATPALSGITADTPAGEILRGELEKLGLRNASHPWPKSEIRRKHGHETRRRRDFAAFYDYFAKNALLPVSETTSSPETDIFAAFETSYGTVIAELNEVSMRVSNLFLPPQTSSYKTGSLHFFKTQKELSAIQSLSRGLMLHAHLALRLEHADTALSDIRTMQKLATAVQTDYKSIISHLVGNNITLMGMEPIWEGLADRCWSDQQLRELQQLLSLREISEEMKDAIRTELVHSDELLAALEEKPSIALDPSAPLTKLYPLLSPWLDHNRAQLIELYHQGILTPMKNPDGYIRALAESATIMGRIESSATFNPRTIIVRLLVPTASMFVEKSARTHAELAVATAACALERYYLVNQSYPNKLEALVPDFAKQLPTDPTNGKPLHYERTDEGRYQLYSIGPDGRDDQGGEGDITWNYEIQR